MKYTAPPTQVVCENTRDKGHILAPIPPCWSGLLNAHREDPVTVSFAFLHERTSRRQGSRLIAVTIFGNATSWQIYANVYDTSGRSIKWVHGTLTFADANSFRIFAGQSDPSDPSHFMIPFESGGEKGTIEGWLQDDDVIKLQ